MRLSPEDVPALWLRAVERATRSYRMCGRVLRLHCDSCEYARRFEDAFLRLRLDAGLAPEPSSEITFLTRQAGPEGCPALLHAQDGRIRVFEHEEVEPTQLFYCLAFMEKRMFALTDHIILHGSVVEHGGNVTALVGMTNSGKSTLGLRLALEPGVAFLSDELCPIRLTDGIVDPFPRCLGLRQKAREFLLERGAIAPATVPTATPQIEVDPLSIRGLVLGTGGPLQNVVLLSGSGLAGRDGGVRLLNVQFVNQRLIADLRAIPGVRDVHVLEEPVGSGIAVRIEVTEGAKVTAEIIRVCRDTHKMELLGFLSPRASRPDFTRPPCLVSVKTLEGIMELVRHLVNFNLLEDRFAGSYSGLIDCLAARLGHARFFSLRPGPLEDTSRLIRQQVLGA
jgi:hypothetical protein